MHFQDSNSPFNQEQAELLNRLIPTLTETQQVWLSGYLSALQKTTSSNGASLTQADPTANTALTEQNAPSQEVTVLFGSQTGNGQGLAADLSRKLEERGFQVTLSSMSDYKPKNLKQVKNLLLIVSTHGEGDPPDNAMTFYEFLHSKRAPKLEDLQYSVLSLGDRSYEFFCQTGKDFDKRLQELGGKPISQRVDCDVDFDEDAAEWFENVFQALGENLKISSVPTVGIQASSNELLSEQPVYSRTHPFKAEVLENLNLNGRGSNRETHHLELSLEGSNLQFEPGDSLGVYPENHPDLVDTLIEEMGWKSEEPVSINKKEDKRPLRDALLENFEITVLTKPLIEQAAKLSSNSSLHGLLDSEREQELKSYIKERDLLDLVKDYSLKGLTASDFTAILRKMPARLYSIASSHQANPDEVHLTIRTVRYHTHGRDRFGVCSVQCAERLQPGDTLPVYIQHNPNFKLPDNPDTPIIMIGPGTGVAPFRAFLEEREEIEATGKSWLFFGDQHFLTDFLYQVEWQKWLKQGVLTQMDVAFSRDTAEKIYVQHRLLEKAQEIYQWLEEGAYVYICGDEKHMAKDVHAAILKVLQQEGGMSAEKAEAYLADMQQQKRYQRDIY